MKIFKQQQQSIIPRPFVLQGKNRMGVGVLVFFDLNDPDHPLTEQDLWKTVPDQLGQGGALDQGLPKVQGEVLVFGSCCAPKGTTRNASRVSIEVGPVRKSIDVYGDRFWEAGRITPPLAFTEMPLIWENAFGGPEYPKNPLGKGFEPVTGPAGGTMHPLPNLEVPGQTIGSPADQPEPAGFSPLDQTWPQRTRFQGTYDERWKQERWPWYPDDMNPLLFNLACPDQHIEGFFSGGERVAIAGMHPDLPVIESRLPSLRMRCFVSLDSTYKPHRYPPAPLPSLQLRESDEFREIPTRLETVWLFPKIMRGLVLFRGATDIRDDEMADVLRILVRPEPLEEQPKSIEYYRDLQIRELDRGVNIDPEPIRKAQKLVQNAKRQIGNIPKKIDAMRRSALGQTPAEPPPDPAHQAARFHRLLDQQSALVNQMEQTKVDVEARVGVKAPLDPGMFDHFRGTIAHMRQTLDETTAKATEARDSVLKKQEQGLEDAKKGFQKLSPALQAKAGLDPEQPFKPVDPFKGPDHGPWHNTGFPFVVACRNALELDDATQAALRRLGFEPETWSRYWLGISGEARQWPGLEFGLKDVPEVTVPAGLVVPRFDGPVLKRVLVRPADAEHSFHAMQDEKLAEGSDEAPLFLASASLIELPQLPAAESAPVVVVPGDLEALFVEQETGDFCSVLAADSAGAQLSEDAGKAMKKAPVILLALPHEYAKQPALVESLAAWKAAFPQVEPLEMEVGTTVFDTHRKEPVRDWVLRHLPPAIAQAHDSGIALPEPGKMLSPDFMKGFKLDFPDLAAIIPAVIAQVRGVYEGKAGELKAQAEAKREEAMGKAREMLVKHGRDPSVLDAKPAGQPADFKAKGKEAADKIRAQMERLQSRHQLSPANAAKMREAADQCERAAAEAQGKWDAGMAQLDSRKKELEAGLEKLKARELPPEAKARFAKVGMDPDKIRALTREQVIEMRDAGRSPDSGILSGVDLSELDLHGMDFSNCQLKKTSFRKSNLAGAIFVKALAGEADFTEANLAGAILERGIFTGAIFHKANLQGANLGNALLNKGDFTEADLREANVYMTMLKEGKFEGANLRGANFELSMIGGDATRADFRDVRMKQVLATDMQLDEASFAGARLFRTMFQQAKGAGVQFTDADLRKFRIGNESQLPGADFSRSDLREAGLRDSDLSGADFTASRLDSAILENCHLTQARLYQASARQARLKGCNLEGADLRFSNFFTGSVAKSRLVGADLRGAQFYSADIFKAVMGETRLEGVNLKGTLLEGREDLLEQASGADRKK